MKVYGMSEKEALEELKSIDKEDKISSIDIKEE